MNTGTLNHGHNKTLNNGNTGTLNNGNIGTLINNDDGTTNDGKGNGFGYGIKKLGKYLRPSLSKMPKIVKLTNVFVWVAEGKEVSGNLTAE